MMPTIGCEEGTLFSSLSVAGGCGTVTSCAGILLVTGVFAFAKSACSIPFSQTVAITDNVQLQNDHSGTTSFARQTY